MADFGADPPSNEGQFNTTHWSVVLLAGQSRTSKAEAALEQLCRSYWYPLYSYVRRKGHSSHNAQDLTQEFFARLLERTLRELPAEAGVGAAAFYDESRTHEGCHASPAQH